MGAAFDGMYLWVANSEDGMIYQIDVTHVAPQLEPNEQVLRRWGIPYDIFGSAGMGGVNLAPYCKVIVASDQTSTFYQTLSDQRAWFEAWIEDGGMFELNGAESVETWTGLPMPGGFTYVDSTTNDVSIRDLTHPILHLPNTISGAELDGWNWATHGYLVDLPSRANSIITHVPSGKPAAAELRMHGGCVLATQQPLEWGWMHRFSPLLENMVLDMSCQPLSLFLPVGLKFSP
jgi:hypothetical protein